MRAEDFVERPTLTDGSPNWPWLLARSLGEHRVAFRPVILDRHHGAMASTCAHPHRYGRGSQEWIVKFKQNPCGDGASLAAEQIVTGAGKLLGAPVADAEIVLVSSELDPERIELLPGLPVAAGLHHGSLRVPGCTDRGDVAYVDDNLERFAAIDVLYLWTHAGDAQFIYQVASQNEVWSYDHGLFFSRAPGRELEQAWTLDDLEAGMTKVERHPKLNGIALPQSAYHSVVRALESVTPMNIAGLCLIPPAQWGLSLTARIHLARYLYVRQRLTLELLRKEGRHP